jgi:ketosteroid isomerase-like protein
MKKNTPFIFIILIALSFPLKSNFAKAAAKIVALNAPELSAATVLTTDTVPPADVMDVVTAVIYSLNNFNIDAVANLYTPNAVIADDEPPYSWNGPTAGIQWVNAVQQVCRDNRLTKLKGQMAAVNVYQQNSDNVYIVVPVIYTGTLPGKTPFEANGAFAFVLRQTNGKWLIKSQVWMPRKAL